MGILVSERVLRFGMAYVCINSIYIEKVKPL